MLLDLWPFQESGVPAPVIPYRKRGVVVGGFTRRAPGDPAFAHCGPSGTVPYTGQAPSAAAYDPNAAPATAYTRVSVGTDSFRRLGVVGAGFTKRIPAGPVFVHSRPTGAVPYVTRAPSAADYEDPDETPTTPYTRSEP